MMEERREKNQMNSSETKELLEAYKLSEKNVKHLEKCKANFDEPLASLFQKALDSEIAIGICFWKQH